MEGDLNLDCGLVDSWEDGLKENAKKLGDSTVPPDIPKPDPDAAEGIHDR